MMQILKWLYKNLFSSIFNTILTLAFLYLFYLIIPPVIKWICVTSSWNYIAARFNQFMYGFYPVGEQWRINLAYIIAAVGFISYLTVSQKHKIWLLVFLLVIYPIIAFVLFYGGILGLPIVATYSWGGLHLTLVVALTGMLFALPLGVLLALGRRSELPIVRVFSIAFIELWRGVPLISVLFMASVMLPLFFSNGTNIDKLLRALIGIALFAAAYMAEVVRGGLQAIPKGQYEAAKSIGFKYWPMMLLIILPQALKISLPNIMNTFIALFKDTTLVMIIGLFDFLGMVQAANSDPKWLPYAMEGYVFAAAVYWIFCFSMSRYSQYLEKNIFNKGII